MPGSFHVTRKQNRAHELNEIESKTTLPRPAVSFPRDLVKARVTSLQKSRVFGDNWACGGGATVPVRKRSPRGEATSRATSSTETPSLGSVSDVLRSRGEPVCAPRR